jgi:hypothetical protein
MKKRWFALYMLIFAPFSIFGQTSDDFNAIVDFNTTLKDLHEAAVKGDDSTLPYRLVIIDGTVAGLEVLVADEAEYLGQVILVSGEWQGVESVVKYQCVVLLEGERFVNAIPARRSRTPHPDEIQLNSRILVVARILGIVEWDSNSNITVLSAEHIRQIK